MPPYAVVCCDGTWMGPSDVHVQTAGAWEKSWMARDPGGPLATVSGEVPVMSPSRRPPRGTWPPAPAVSDLAVHTIREAAACSGLTRRRISRVPNGSPWGGQPPLFRLPTGTRDPSHPRRHRLRGQRRWDARSDPAHAERALAAGQPGWKQTTHWVSLRVIGHSQVGTEGSEGLGAPPCDRLIERRESHRALHAGHEGQ
jgi:hypothetical protein